MPKIIERNASGAIVGAWSAPAYLQQASVPDSDAGLLAYLCATAVGQKLADLDITIDDTAVAATRAPGLFVDRDPAAGIVAAAHHVPRRARHHRQLGHRPCPGGLQRRGAAGLAALGRLRRRQAHALGLMAKYANGLAEQKGLAIRFQAIVPQQMTSGTGSATRGGATGAPPLLRALVGSVIDGEDVVQDTLARALVTLDELQEAL